MNLPYRIELLSKLGEYMVSSEEAWCEARDRAYRHNGWFIPSFIDLACTQIAGSWLKKEALLKWINQYPHGGDMPRKTIGIIMAGNIPLVGFHDWLCVFISGHTAMVRLSSGDRILFSHLMDKLMEWEPAVRECISFGDMLKGCDGYIATGSNNSSRYFEYYFRKYPHIIRRNRTSVAILDGNESMDDLGLLADDVFTYFGRGCRNVTKLYVPENYDFVPLLEAFRKYSWIGDHHKYKNNYDYNLALRILNKQFYMTNGSVLLIENNSPFSPISEVNYEFYSPGNGPANLFNLTHEIQCVVGKTYLPFGSTQRPGLDDYADGIDTMAFLAGL